MRNFFKKHGMIYLTAVVACVLVTACEVEVPNSFPAASPVPQTEQPGPSAQGGQPSQTGNTPETDPRYMNVAIQCADARRDDCGLLVTLNAVDDDIELDIRLHGDEGVRFLPNLDVLPQDNGDESTIARVKLLAGESRQILFPYRPSLLDLPGAYQVVVLATEADTNNLYAYNRMNAYIILNEIGEFHLLPSEVEYNGRYRNLFTDGTLGLGYWIELVGDQRPHRGNLWVRVDSRVDGYKPTVEVESSGAVTFLGDSLWQPVVTNMGMKVSRSFPVINEGGARVVKFPFELDRNGRLLDGEYAFLVTLIKENSVEPTTEKIPIVVQLFSDPQYPTERWLGAHTTPPSIATFTPNATESAAAANAILAQSTGFGGSLKGLDAQTAEGHCERMADIRFDGNLPRPNWSRLIANYEGTICQAYLDFVAGSVPLSWTDFEQRMIAENDNLNNPEDMLEDHRVYILPELDQ